MVRRETSRPAAQSPFHGLIKGLSFAPAMIHRFPTFEIDESQRELRSGARVLRLQPRVFDLQVYLSRHRDRVVPKEELLDSVWPGVIVADGSLQRAISLVRSALASAGAPDGDPHFRPTRIPVLRAGRGGGGGRAPRPGWRRAPRGRFCRVGTRWWPPGFLAAPLRFASPLWGVPSGRRVPTAPVSETQTIPIRA